MAKSLAQIKKFSAKLLQHQETMPTVAFFVPEFGDARVLKRIKSFKDQGCQTTVFGFERIRQNYQFQADGNFISLGKTIDRRYLSRAITLANSLVKLAAYRNILEEVDFLYCINIDNAILADIFMRFARTHRPLVLEIADIQDPMLGPGLRSRILRRAEKYILKSASLLVTTSPSFIENYFKTIQKYEGKYFLLENKVPAEICVPTVEEIPLQPVKGACPWIIGYFGVFRCAQSLKIISALADRLQGKVQFLLYGYPNAEIDPKFKQAIKNVTNITYLGPYRYPNELQSIYSKVDFSWSIDLADLNGNSNWLLPNRIYEGGLFGVPQIALKGTETGNWVEKNLAGWSFEKPVEESLIKFFSNLSLDDWRSVRTRNVYRNRFVFTAEQDNKALLNECLHNSKKIAGS